MRKNPLHLGLLAGAGLLGLSLLSGCGDPPPQTISTTTQETTTAPAPMAAPVLPGTPGTTTTTTTHSESTPGY
jgi:hypothetical protein